MDVTQLIPVKVVPRARLSEIVGRQADGSWRVRVAAVPEDGQANEELCRLLAREWGLPRRSVVVVAGLTSTRKMIRVTHGPDWTLPDPEADSRTTETGSRSHEKETGSRSLKKR